ncbi:MAG: NUDIX domain-containing protein [Chloroflexota bacterium]|nr:NUDIX domain-containing protein [Chloroflexota bacterium]
MPRHAGLPLWRDQSVEQKLDTLRAQMLDLYRYQLSPAYASIMTMLDAHQPADDKEAADIDLIKRLIAEHPDILSMSCEVAHITASALIVDRASFRTLLHFHKRLGRWLQVGGHVEYETDIAAAALREAREETGLTDLEFYPASDAAPPVDFDVHTIPQRLMTPEHLHLDFRYLLLTRQPEAIAPDAGESTQIRWMSFDEALALDAAIDPSLKRLLRKGQALLRDLPSGD